jgi:hypothetical protein
MLRLRDVGYAGLELRHDAAVGARLPDTLDNSDGA